MNDDTHPAGIENFRAGGNIQASIGSGSIGTCRVQAGGSISSGGAGTSINSGAGIAQVLVDNGSLVVNVRALGGAIGEIAVPNGNIGHLPPVAVGHVITATNGIGSITASGSIAANITAGGSIGSFDAGLDYRGNLTMSGFDTFHIGQDFWGPGIITLTNALPANRLMAIDRYTGLSSQINLPAAGLLGQIDINRDNAGGLWSGVVNVGSTTLTVAGYTNSASSLAGR